MAQALTRFYAYGQYLTDTSRKRGVQKVVMKCTAANTDVTYDLSNASGTFWTAAKADATYGAVATAALAALQAVAANSAYYSQTKVSGGFFQDDDITATSYSVSVSSLIPTLTFNSGTAPTDFVIEMEWHLADGVVPMHYDLG